MLPNAQQPTEEETRLAEEGSRQLAPLADLDDFHATLRVGRGRKSREVQMPASVVHLVLEIFRQMARGRPVTIVPLDAELTTQQAADILGVSRPFLVQQLEAGRIPYRRLGTHRRVRYQDVLAFRRHIDADRRKALDELAALSEELGLYD